MTRRRVRTAVLGAWLCAFAVPLPPAAPPAAAQASGASLTYASAANPGSLDPHVAGSLADLEIVHHLFETLVAVDESYNPRPMLAARVETADGGRSFRFQLRPDVRFHDGRTMTAPDVQASFERYARISPNAALLADVAGYETPDPLTFVVRLRAPNPVFLDALRTPTYPLAILPADQADRPGGEAEIIGTGPFALEHWEKEEHLVLRRHEGYTADRAARGPDGLAGRKRVLLDRVRVDFLPAQEARVAALRDGTADIVSGLAPDLLAEMAAMPHVAIQNVFPYCQLVFATNAAAGPTRSERVRQAVRAALHVDEVLGGGAVARRNPSLLYPGSPYYAAEAASPFYDQRDTAGARRLLAAAGYAGEMLVLQTNDTYAYMRAAMEVFANQLRVAGFAVRVEVVDWRSNSANLRRGTGGWHVTTAGFCTQPLIGPVQWRRIFQTYAASRDDPVIEDGFRRFVAGQDVATRRAAWRDIERRVLDQGYFVKVADLGAVRAHNTRVRGLAPFFFLRFWNTWVS